jgi:hypothetical protein
MPRGNVTARPQSSRTSFRPWPQSSIGERRHPRELGPNAQVRPRPARPYSVNQGTNFAAHPASVPATIFPVTVESSPLIFRFTGPGPTVRSVWLACALYLSGPSSSSTPSIVTPMRCVWSNPFDWIFPPPEIRTLCSRMFRYTGYWSASFPGNVYAVSRRIGYFESARTRRRT